MAQIILVIDPDLDRVSALRPELSYLGYETSHVTDPVEAFKLNATHRFDAVLADLETWRTEAGELSNILGDRAAAPPVIILTKLASIVRAAKAVQSGAFLYLMRPLRRDQIQAALERAFES